MEKRDCRNTNGIQTFAAQTNADPGQIAGKEEKNTHIESN